MYPPVTPTSLIRPALTFGILLVFALGLSSALSSSTALEATDTSSAISVLAPSSLGEVGLENSESPSTETLHHH